MSMSMVLSEPAVPQARKPAGHRRNMALDGLSVDAFALIEPYLQARDFMAGEPLWRFGDAIERVYFPRHGAVSVVMSAGRESGNYIEVAMIGRDGVAGGVALRGNGQPTGGVAATGGTFSMMSAPQLGRLAQMNPEIARMRRRAVEWMLTQSRQYAVCGVAHYASQRIAGYLLRLADRAPGGHIEVKQCEIASALGIRRTTVTLIQQGLHRDHLIDYRRGKVWITDRDRLRAAACSCYGALCPAASPFAAQEVGG